MKQLLSLSTLLALLLFVCACNKKSTTTTTPTTKTKKDYLTQSAWKYSAVKVQVNGGSWIDALALAQQCEKDNIFTYKTDMTFMETEGATKCSVGDPDIASSGTWAFASNDTKLNVTIFGSTDNYDIMTLDASTLKIKITEVSGTDTYITELTFVH